MSLPRSRLFFVHTGGTLGMTSAGPGPLSPRHYAEAVMPYVRGLEAVADIEGQVVCNIDSSDMEPQLWEEIGATIWARRQDYDGFVVLHGTDTMAWTASALSYMLPGLEKPVILTGSQRPISAWPSDGRSNLVHATICAARRLREVGVYFGSQLYRGNRATKVSIQSYTAFASPNFPPLLTMGVEIEEGPAWDWGSRASEWRPGFCQEVLTISLFPGMSPRALEVAADSGARAVVLRGFGEGNLPQRGWPEAVERLARQGLTIAVASQCQQGRVLPGRYEGSAQARDSGALFPGDMTLEALTTKLMWLLGQGLNRDEVAAQLLVPLAGELQA